jgi:SagB-type dehydrogenase family enzyme
MRKELTSFFAVLFLALTVILGILLVNAKRQLVQVDRESQSEAEEKLVPSAEKKVAKLSAPRTYASPIQLPAPKLKGTLSVEQAIAERRTLRSFKDEPLTLAQLSQMLWAAQGITEAKTGKRTAPSARSVYFYSVYVLVRDVTGLKPGLYEYLPKEHALGDMKVADASTIFNNAGVEAGAKTPPVVVMLTAAIDKGIEKLGEGSKTSAYLEGGHIGQNMYLQAQALKLGMVVMGGTGTAAQALKLDPAETMVYVIPMGVPAPAASPTAAPVEK